MKLILVVCTANICRSPMAAALLRQRLADMDLADQIDVQSAGVWAREGQEASQHAVTVLAERGIPLDEHRSQPTTPQLLDKADLVLVMEEAHRRSLFYLSPQYLSKVYLLSEMAGHHGDIADPYGRSRGDYVRTVETLEQLISAGLPTILKKVGISTGAERQSRSGPGEAGANASAQSW